MDDNIKIAEGDAEVYHDDGGDPVMMIHEQSEEEFMVWKQSEILRRAFMNAAATVMDAAGGAFAEGEDEIALFLRAISKQLKERAEVESYEWQKNHKTK